MTAIKPPIDDHQTAMANPSVHSFFNLVFLFGRKAGYGRRERTGRLGETEHKKSEDHSDDDCPNRGRKDGLQQGSL
jgi:hypothetical protein